MSANRRVVALGAAIALAVGSTAFANTNLDGGTTGDLFINVVDATNNSSFLFDTGVSQASFNGSVASNFNISADANYQAFAAGEAAGDTIDYSILSATKTTANPQVGTVFFTTNQTPAAVPGNAIAQAQTNINGFLSLANTVTSSSSKSVFLSASTGDTWGQAQYETAVAGNLNIPYTQGGTGDSALLGTPLNFYSESSNALRSAQTNATLTTFGGTWDFLNGIASYTPTSGGGGSVPLPTPVVLLLSGLGLMSLVSRRKNKVVGDAQFA